MHRKTTEYFSMTRFFVFLPFYLLGYYFDINYVKKFFTKRYTLLSIAVFLLFGVFLYFFDFNLINIFYGKVSLARYGFVLSIVIRLLHYILSFILIFAFMIIVPKTKTIYTAIGEKTLQIYLLHIPIVYMFMGKSNILTNGYDFYKFINSYPRLLLLVIGVIILMIILSSKLLSKPFDKIMSLKFDFVYNKKSE